MAVKLKISEIVQKMDLKPLTTEVDYSERYVVKPDINRPALQLAGYFEHFASDRVQIVGNVEHSYLKKMSVEERQRIYDTFLSFDVPCVVYCRDITPEKAFVEKATKAGVPIFSTSMGTSEFMSTIIRWMTVQFAPMISVHGVLVDVYGVGVMIMGESGIGKSEAALELVKRGHRLISDDVVEIRKVSNETLVGSAPDITRHFIELRGIGIVDVRNLFGTLSVRETHSVDLVIILEEWDRETEYDRLGLENQYTEFLGNKVVCHHLPVRPGRNLAIIVETASINLRQKAMGYNAAEELYRRVQKNFMK